MATARLLINRVGLHRRVPCPTGSIRLGPVPFMPLFASALECPGKPSNDSPSPSGSYSSYFRRKSLGEHFTAAHRTSGSAAPGNLGAACTNDVSRERHAHASADRCTGTVIVEPLHRQCEEASSSAYTVIDETVPSESRRTPWLRTSMRRLQQVALPSSGGSGGPDQRPVSAPSRLPPPEPTAGKFVLGHLAGSCSWLVPDRDQRASSPSSSTTSIVSSVDSAQSRLPPLEPATTTPAGSSSNNNSPRR